MTRDEMVQLKECLRLVREARKHMTESPLAASYVDKALQSLPLLFRESYVAEVVDDIVKNATDLHGRMPPFDDVSLLTSWMREVRDLAIRVDGVPLDMRTARLKSSIAALRDSFVKAKAEVERRAHSAV